MNISEIYDPTAIADHYHQRIQVLAQAIKAQGFRVWIAKAGNYGFYSNTEGSSLVSFTINLTVLHFSGNIESKTLIGKEVSWVLDDGTYEEMLKQPPPPSVQASVKGGWQYTTVKDYLAMYGASSKFTEI